jgi:hypothetical protein
MSADTPEDPVANMITDVMDGPGYKGMIICNAQGIMIRYDGFNYQQGLVLTNGILGLYNHCQNSMKRLMVPDESGVESVRIKCATFEIICTQHGNFTFIVKQSFVPDSVEGDEEGDEGGEAKY